MSLHLRTLTLLLAGLAAPLGALGASRSGAACNISVTNERLGRRALQGGAVERPERGGGAARQYLRGRPRGGRAAGSGARAAGSGAAPRPASAHSPGGSASGSRAPAGTAAGGKPTATDRLELGTATVTGDREQPKVMYIVPWKKSDIGDLSGKPMNSLLDEALAPVDRDEFKRQVMYYQVVKADASQNGAAKPPAAQGEK